MNRANEETTEHMQINVITLFKEQPPVLFGDKWTSRYSATLFFEDPLLIYTLVFQISSFHKIFGWDVFITFILSTDSANSILPGSIIPPHSEQLEIQQICWQRRELFMTWQSS